MAEKQEYLVCERRSVFALLTLSAGMMGAYTFNLRGGVFCNAQTANVVLMAIAFGAGSWLEGCYYFIPISAYLAGAFLSEILPSPVRRFGFLRWDTYLVAFECLSLLAIGFIPLGWPHQLVQVLVNFIASMQYNTFRQAEGIPMATTFCTNQLRQVGVGQNAPERRPGWFTSRPVLFGDAGLLFRWRGTLHHCQPPAVRQSYLAELDPLGYRAGTADSRRLG